MVKFFKRLFKILGAILVVGMIAVISLITLVDPTHFKDTLQKQVSLKTGHPFTIEGPLAWRIGSGLTLEAYNIKLDNIENFSNEFITLKKARLETNLWSFFSGRGLFKTQLDGLNVHLSRDYSGQSNWEGLIKYISQDKTSFPNEFGLLLLSSLHITQAKLILQDELKNQHIQLQDLTLNAVQLTSKFSNLSIPFTLNFNFEDLITKHVGNMQMNANCALNHPSKKLAFDNLILKLSFQNIPPTTILGELSIDHAGISPIIQGKIQLPNMPLNGWLEQLKAPLLGIQSNTTNIQGTFKYQFPTLEISSLALGLEKNGALDGKFNIDVQAKSLQTLNITGYIQAKNLEVEHLPLTEIKTNFSAKNGIVHFAPFKLRIANSQHQGNLQVDLNEKIPKFFWTNQMDSFEVNDFLTLFNAKDWVAGRVQANMILTAYGERVSEILQTLSGETQISLSNGKLYGIELPPLLQHAQSTVLSLSDSFSKKQATNVSAVLAAELDEWKQQATTIKPLSTPFRTAKINLKIENGLLTTTDLKLTHPEYILNGKGTLDLVSRKMEYQAFALLTRPVELSQKELTRFLKDSPLPIQIKGPLNNLSIQPDLLNYTQGALKIVHKDKEPIESFEKSTDKTLEKLFGFP